jgi:citrate lyase subunit beta / citryl-CoA lyase
LSVPPLTWLYVPADRPDRVEKAIASETHAVIVDLEDGVAEMAKAEARANLSELLGRERGKPVAVRVNSLRTEHGAADLAAVAGLAGATSIHLPKVDAPADVHAVLQLLPPGSYRLHCLIESPVGVEAAYAIATSAPEVAGLSLGEADLRSALGAGDAGLDWARSRIVNAAVAAGLPRPPQSVYPRIDDVDGLARSCARGRELGHLGRAAVHPRQLPVILQAYLPTEEEVARARARHWRPQAPRCSRAASSSTPRCCTAPRRLSRSPTSTAPHRPSIDVSFSFGLSFPFGSWSGVGSRANAKPGERWITAGRCRQGSYPPPRLPRSPDGHARDAVTRTHCAP